MLRQQLVNLVAETIGATSYLQVGSSLYLDEVRCPLKVCHTPDSPYPMPDGRFDVVYVHPPLEPGKALDLLRYGLARLTDHGILLVGNVNPSEEWQQEVPPSRGVQLGQGWMAWVEFRHAVGRRTCTVDADHGVGVVLPTSAPPEQIHPPDWRSFSVFAAHRERLLGLVQEGALEGIVRGALIPEAIPEEAQPEPVQPTPRRRRRDR